MKPDYTLYTRGAKPIARWLDYFYEVYNVAGEHINERFLGYRFGQQQSACALFLAAIAISKSVAIGNRVVFTKKADGAMESSDELKALLGDPCDDPIYALQRCNNGRSPVGQTAQLMNHYPLSDLKSYCYQKTSLLEWAALNGDNLFQSEIYVYNDPDNNVHITRLDPAEVFDVSFDRLIFRKTSGKNDVIVDVQTRRNFCIYSIMIALLTSHSVGIYSGRGLSCSCVKSPFVVDKGKRRARVKDVLAYCEKIVATVDNYGSSMLFDVPSLTFYGYLRVILALGIENVSKFSLADPANVSLERLPRLTPISGWSFKKIDSQTRDVVIFANEDNQRWAFGLINASLSIKSAQFLFTCKWLRRAVGQNWHHYSLIFLPYLYSRGFPYLQIYCWEFLGNPGRYDSIFSLNYSPLSPTVLEDRIVRERPLSTDFIAMSRGGYSQTKIDDDVLKWLLFLRPRLSDVKTYLDGLKTPNSKLKRRFADLNLDMLTSSDVSPTCLRSVIVREREISISAFDNESFGDWLINSLLIEYKERQLKLNKYKY